MKRVAVHVLIILLLGIGGGIALRIGKYGSQRVWQEMLVALGVADAPSSSGIETTPAKSNGKSIAGKVLPPPADLPDFLTEFTLTERSGEAVHSKDLLGKPYLVSFFFTTCPSVCVMQNQAMRQLQQEFAGKPVKFLSITVDPETDTPEALQEYAARFGADPEQWLFLTGDLIYIRRVSGEIYQLAADKAFHSEKFVLVDHEGKIIDRYSWRDPKQLERLKQKLNDEFAAIKP